MVTRRATLAVLTSALLAGCAQNKPIVLDRQALAGIKRIGLPAVGVPRSPDVRVVNGISERMAGFGLIGAIGQISGSVVRGNRSDALAAMMAAQGFDPGPALTAMLTVALGAKGYTIVPVAADPKRRFLPAIGPVPETDAVLDCYVMTYGFTALNDDNDSPYRASAMVAARLIAASGAVLMQDAVVISAGDTPAGVSTEVAAPGTPVVAHGTFRSFSDVERDPAVGVDALRAVFQAAAAGVVRRVT